MAVNNQITVNEVLFNEQLINKQNNYPNFHHYEQKCVLLFNVFLRHD